MERTTEMKLLRSFVIVAGVALALGAADRAQAAGIGVPCIGCNNGGGGGGAGAGPAQRKTLFNGQFHGFGLIQPKAKLPAFQAAPWYNYWPYDGHFLTPAPINGGAFYGPPMTGNFPVNPYFPGAQGYGPPQGYPQQMMPQPYPPQQGMGMPQPMPLAPPQPLPPNR